MILLYGTTVLYGVYYNASKKNVSVCQKIDFWSIFSQMVYLDCSIRVTTYSISIFVDQFPETL